MYILFWVLAAWPSSLYSLLKFIVATWSFEMSEILAFTSFGIKLTKYMKNLTVQKKIKPERQRRRSSCYTTKNRIIRQHLSNVCPYMIYVHITISKYTQYWINTIEQSKSPNIHYKSHYRWLSPHHGPLNLNDLESKHNRFTMLSWSFLSNLSQIRTFWQSNPKLTFDLGWPQK